MAGNNQNTTNQSSPMADESQNLTNSRSNVRRRLDFGSDELDEDPIQKLQGDDQEKERQKSIEKWNFDFQNEIPLTGDWQWEKVTTVENAPNSTEVIAGTKDKVNENRNV